MFASSTSSKRMIFILTISIMFTIVISHGALNFEILKQDPDGTYLGANERRITWTVDKKITNAKTEIGLMTLCPPEGVKIVAGSTHNSVKIDQNEYELTMQTDEHYKWQNTAAPTQPALDDDAMDLELNRRAREHEVWYTKNNLYFKHRIQVGNLEVLSDKEHRFIARQSYVDMYDDNDYYSQSNHMDPKKNKLLPIAHSEHSDAGYVYGGAYDVGNDGSNNTLLWCVVVMAVLMVLCGCGALCIGIVLCGYALYLRNQDEGKRNRMMANDIQMSQ
eukprot:36786_1